jgi:transposase
MPPELADKTPEQLCALLLRQTEEIGRLQSEKAALEQENRWFHEQYLLARHRLFGPKSEKTPPGMEGLFFNEAEQTADPTEPEPTTETITYKRRKVAGKRQAELADLPVEEIVYELPSQEQVCPECGGALHPMGEDVRQELKFVPAHVTLVKHLRKKYACRHCQQEAEHTPIVSAPMPAPAFPNSLASPSAMAHILHQKYAMGLPLYRQEQEFACLGIPLSRKTLANWVIRAADDWLEPVYDRLHSHLVKRRYLKADETRVQVLHEDGRPAQSDSFEWLYRTGRDGPPIVLFEYQPTREAKHPKQFLHGFAGFLQTDGYQAYESLPDVVLVGCWAHARRKFTDALQVLPEPQRKRGGTPTHAGLSCCNAIFRVERGLADATPEQRHALRLEKTQPILTEFRVWLDVHAVTVLPKSPLGQAITYCLNQWEKLTAFLLDGNLDVDNNSSERAIKYFVVGRKNWLFSDTPRGARASAMVYSIVATARANGLDVRAYLQYLFEQLPNVTTSQLDDLLPWSETLPDCVHAPGKRST